MKESYEGHTPHDQILKAVRQPVQNLDVEAQSVLGGHTFERFQLGDFVLQLLLATEEFRTRAMSYRGFNVGAGAWCLDYPRYGRVLGFNVKIDDTDQVNIHAEDLITAKAQDAGYKEISVLTVIGPTQPDHASGKETETLHPCGRCRNRLMESPLISDRTLFVTARPDFRVVQCANLPAIIALHDHGDEEGITTFRFDETPAILRPLQLSNESSMIHRIDHEIDSEIDNRDYDSSIGKFLLDRFVSTRS